MNTESFKFYKIWSTFRILKCNILTLKFSNSMGLFFFYKTKKNAIKETICKKKTKFKNKTVTKHEISNKMKKNLSRNRNIYDFFLQSFIFNDIHKKKTVSVYVNKLIFIFYLFIFIFLVNKALGYPIF